MDGVFLFGKLGTANRDLYHYDMSMLDCWSQTLQLFYSLFRERRAAGIYNRAS